MAEGTLQQRTDAILRRLVRKDAGPAVRKMLARTRPADVAAAMTFMTAEERRRLYRLIEDKDHAAEVMALLDEDAVHDLVVEMTEDQVVDLLDRMEPDDATDVVANLPEALREKVLSELADDPEDDLAELIRWPADSAGGIMSPIVFTTPETATCGEAIIRLQELAAELDSVFYLYLVDTKDRLSGVVSLRALLVHPPSTPLVSIMAKDVISVLPTQDQEEVARLVARYDLLAVPVVDEERHLLGVITVDDVVDVIREEAAEDMLLMAGVPEDAAVGERSVLKLARVRAGWLVATAVGGVLADRVMGLFGGAVPLEVVAGMIPVVMGMGGNVGIQSGTIAVRGLATGHVQTMGAVTFIWREARVGLAIGLVYASLLGAYGTVGGGAIGASLGLTVGLAVLLAITLGSVLGSSLPLVFDRLGIDPAIATGPFVLTGVDLMGITLYLSVARMLIPG